MNATAPHTQAERLIERLGHAGLIPFVALAALLWLVAPEFQPFVALALAAYGATIVAFLGGIHWGMGLLHAHDAAPARRLHLLWGVTPPLLAWLALLMPPYAALPLLAAILVGCYLVDRRTWRAAGLGAWLPLRRRLTTVATLACLVGAAAT